MFISIYILLALSLVKNKDFITKDRIRMSKVFYQYASEQVKIKKEKQLLSEGESTCSLTRSKNNNNPKNLKN